VLRVAAAAIVAVAVAIRLAFIAVAWLASDPRLSRERLRYWGEWIACLHNSGHLYVLVLEIAAGDWFVAGVVLVLGRSLPWYLSMPATGAMAAVLVAVHGDPGFLFAPPDVPLAAAGFVAGPAAGACLFGTAARARRRTERRRLERAAKVFE